MHLLLLHGAGLGSWIWDRARVHLRTQATAIDLPGRGGDRNPGEVTFGECVDRVLAELERHPKSIIAGHSIAACIALVAAARRPMNVAAVVLVGGMVPASGEPFLSLLPFPQRLFLRLLLKRARNGIALPASLVRKEYCNDLDEETTELVVRNVTREVPQLYLEDVHWAPLRVPCAYVKLLDDRSVKVAQQDAIIARVGAKPIVTLHSGHLPMLARPAETAAALDQLVDTLLPA